MARTRLRSSDDKVLHALFAKSAMQEPMTAAEVARMQHLVQKRRKLAMNDPAVRVEIAASANRLRKIRRLIRQFERLTAAQ